MLSGENGGGRECKKKEKECYVRLSLLQYRAIIFLS